MPDVKFRRLSCDGCGRSTLLGDLGCDDKFSGLYCRGCLPQPGNSLPPAKEA